MKVDESLSEERVIEIKKTIKDKTTPRHVPKEVIAVGDIPYTRSGKKMELAVTRLISGKELNQYRGSIKSRKVTSVGSNIVEAND